MSRDSNLHKEVMLNILKYINNRSDDFILKGGTALMFCYNLDRFSEDLDFDTGNKMLFNILKSFAKENDYVLNVAKDINTSQRL